jgi:hypothetical protein
MREIYKNFDYLVGYISSTKRVHEFAGDQNILPSRAIAFQVRGKKIVFEVVDLIDGGSHPRWQSKVGVVGNAHDFGTIFFLDGSTNHENFITGIFFQHGESWQKADCSEYLYADVEIMQVMRDIGDDFLPTLQ